MNEAAILAARKNLKAIDQQQFFDSVEKVLLGPERRSRAISDKEKEITAYHEGGHALCGGINLPIPIRDKVSIISRGFAGGYTLKLPNEDQHIKTKSNSLQILAVMLGGMWPNPLTFNDVSTVLQMI